MVEHKISAPISIDERETHFFYNGDEVWCDTTTPAVWRKCQKQGWTVVSQTTYDGNVVGMILRAQKHALSIRNAESSRREMTEEQRLAAAERLRAAREKKNGGCTDE